MTIRSKAEDISEARVALRALFMRPDLTGPECHDVRRAMDYLEMLPRASAETPVALPEHLRDPFKVIERGNELLKTWPGQETRGGLHEGHCAKLNGGACSCGATQPTQDIDLLGYLKQQMETKVCPECAGEKTVCYPSGDTRYPCPECTEPPPEATAANRSDAL